MINRKLHGLLEIRHLSSLFEKYFTRSLGSIVKYFSTSEDKRRISVRPCNILYISFISALFKRKDSVCPTNRFSTLWREQRSAEWGLVPHELWNNSNVQARLAKLRRIFSEVCQQDHVGRRGLGYNRQFCQRWTGNRAQTFSMDLPLLSY